MAAQNVTLQVDFSCDAVETMTAGLVTPYTVAASGAINATLANGTGATLTVDALYAKQLTLAGAATHVDLYAFTDPAGNSVSMARCRFLWLNVVTATAGYIVNLYTRTGTDPVTWLPVTTTSALWCPPGGAIILYDPASTSTNGFVVGSAAFDVTVDPGANTVVCNLIMAGNSAA